MFRLFCKKEDDLSKLRKAEAEMIEYAKKFGDRDSDSYEIKAEDTRIPAKVLPLRRGKKLKKDLHMHHVKVTSLKDDDCDSSKEDIPIVILHGYMNGALYFYRNVVSLSNHFHTVYSVDTLGMGLSSRKPGLLKKVGRSVQATEKFFVEALEAWRKANGIEKFILAGHSIGGYLGVPYAEQYPERVAHLLLLTPVGLTRENGDEIKEMLNSMSWTQRQTASIIRYLFDCGVTPASFFAILATISFETNGAKVCRTTTSRHFGSQRTTSSCQLLVLFGNGTGIWRKHVESILAIEFTWHSSYSRPDSQIASPTS
mmetsp:Transcript_35155/g.85150  ORF Transcript_35155/g.85150 Transcript_35155/m.85150 type:complete len:313 (+) Transcript_35155:148-1086(+)